MPTTLSGFKDHALYALERHLLKDQIIIPQSVELGKFRGEPVYARSAVLDLKTAENWIRRGRSIRSGEQPLKWVKQRAVTISRKRELEVLRESSGAGAGDTEGQGLMQGLYAERQTELYEPLPIVDGIIPKNDFGNIDLYVPSMLPQGAAHIARTHIGPCFRTINGSHFWRIDKGTAKIARLLGFNYAEAVVSIDVSR